MMKNCNGNKSYISLYSTRDEGSRAPENPKLPYMERKSGLGGYCHEMPQISRCPCVSVHVLAHSHSGWLDCAWGWGCPQVPRPWLKGEEFVDLTIEACSTQQTTISCAAPSWIAVSMSTCSRGSHNCCIYFASRMCAVLRTRSLMLSEWCTASLVLSVLSCSS